MGKYKLLAIINVWLREVHSVMENLHTPVEVVFIHACLNFPFLSPYGFSASSNSYSHTVIGRMVKKKAPTDMTATKQHRNSGRGEAHQTSHQYRIIKGAAKVVGCIIGLIVALVMWVVIRPIFRGVGWLISILTMTAIIYWLMTL